MKTAQEAAYGELAIDKIKTLFENELTEWEQTDILEWMMNKLGVAKIENSDTISTHAIEDNFDEYF